MEERLKDSEVAEHAEGKPKSPVHKTKTHRTSGINYLLKMIKEEPEEYKKMYARLPSGAKHFLGEFLQDKLTQQREKEQDPGNVFRQFCET